jgi:hypothetical protein
MFHAVVNGGCLCHLIVATFHQILSRNVEDREANNKGNHYATVIIMSLKCPYIIIAISDTRVR